MFGEKPIYGQSIVHPDAKGRMILPSFTQAEEKDRLLLINDLKGIRVLREESIDDYISYLEQLLKEELDPKQIQLIEDRLNGISAKILKSVSCDKQHRILTSNVLIPGQKYLIIGCRSSVLIREPNEKDIHLRLTAK